MSDFLQNLVLRAAGLPMTSTPEPRASPAAEPLELAGEDEAAPVDEPVPAAPVRPERERQPEAPPGRPVVIEPEKAGVPEDVIKQFGAVREPVAIAEEGGDVPVLPPQAVTPREERQPLTVIEREVVRERVVETAGQMKETPPALVQPAVAPVIVPRETIVERETLAGEPAALDVPEAAPPVVLQPIVVEQTRTVVEPVREERTIVETRVEHAAPTAVPVDAPEAVEEVAPRVVMQPRGGATAPAQREERDVPVALAPPTPATNAEVIEHEPPPPHTLVLPQPPAPQAQQQSASEGARQPEIDIRIGTIEIRAAAPPPPSAPPAPSVNIIRAPEPPSNFDAYTSLRNYHFPDVW